MDNFHKQASNLVRAAIDAKAQVDDLMKPTEERVRGVVRHLSRPKHAFETNEDFELRLTHARSIETLLAENKALRVALSNMVEDGDKTDREAAIKLLGWNRAMLTATEEEG